MWVELISSVSPEVAFSHPVDEGDFPGAESMLGQSIPGELKSLMLESDGVADEFGCNFIWTLGELVRRNREMRNSVEFRQLYMSFDSLLFFGDSGNGDLFSFIVAPARPDIFVWQHESDSRFWIANDLRDFLVRHLAAGGEEWYSD